MGIKTRVGWITACEKDNKIFYVKFSKTNEQSKTKVLKKFKKNLLKYFNKKTNCIQGYYEQKGNRIQKKIWNEIKKIKIGKTKSYGEIAKKYNLSPRYVGKICGQNKLPLIIPCHRVIKSDGSLGGFSGSGGINLKKKLLYFEKKIN